MKGMSVVWFNVFVAVVVTVNLCGFTMSKECTNVPTQLSSHTLRYELLSSNNETWKQEMFAHYHLTPTDDSAWSNLLPRKFLREEDELNWSMMYRKMKSPFESAGNFLKEVSLHAVRLDPSSIHWRAQQTNLEYLLLLDVDRLVWSFRNTAGMDSLPGLPYGGWERPDVELRGHFVGHYLSASAKMWASTHNETLKVKMTEIVNVLSKCQKAIGSGYLSAFPSELFDRFEAIKPVWAPYYTIHKIMAGLLDQYLFADNNEALNMTKWMADYFYKRVQNVITKYTVERHFTSLNEETGGMNDVLYRLFSITGDSKHLVLAHLFDKPCFLGLLAVKADDISRFHANTHIPVVIGAQIRYEITGDALYKEIGSFFLDVVNSSHSYATGGTSVGEFWSDPKRLASTLDSENEESCTTYNMLKVSRHLFRWTKELMYADYYERALTNGVLGIQRGTEPGVMIYMLPLGPGSSKATSYHGWGTYNESFWCCYGTGIESFSKLGDSIYFEEDGEVPGLYIIQYISSSLDWDSGSVVVNQKVDSVVSWDQNLRVAFTFSPKKGEAALSTLNFRIPVWTNVDGVTAALNDQSIVVPAPGNFLSITRRWDSGDKLILQLPINLRTEAIKDDRSNYSSLQAILYGPYLLAGHSAGEWDIQTQSTASLSDWITPIPSSYNDQLVSFTQESGDTTLVLTNTNRSITLEALPKSGTNATVHATFRLILNGSYKKFSRIEDAVGEIVKLEPFDLPGLLLVDQGKDKSLTVANSASGGASSTFRLVPGLDGKNGTVSLESVNQKGCFVSSGVNYKSGAGLKLLCSTKPSAVGFSQGASFAIKGGLTSYNPISFVAKGQKQSFLLAPLYSFRDETYTVYFNIYS